MPALSKVESNDNVIYAKSLLPESYSVKDLYFLVYPYEGQIFTGLKDPFNFSRYFWRRQTSYFSTDGAAEDPSTWLYFTIRQIGTLVVRDYLRAMVDNEEYSERSLSDLSFLLFVEAAILNPDVTFGHCKVNDSEFISELLLASGTTDVNDQMREILLYSNELNIRRFKIL